MERVNKLISVRPVNSRYGGEVGDVVVGRIAEVQHKRWKVHIQGRTDATLQLSAVNLPGGAQRRRTIEDQLQMRDFFCEDDLISAEIQQFYSDGSIQLHTRSTKYGKLANGTLVSVPASLVKRGKQHFVTLPCGVDMILGHNGFVHISWNDPTSAPAPSQFQPPAQTAAKAAEDSAHLLTMDARLTIARVRNSLMALAAVFVAISPDTVMDVYSASAQASIHPKDMMSKASLEVITSAAIQRANNQVATGADTQ